jgi:hypothetical protein
MITDSETPQLPAVALEAPMLPDLLQAEVDFARGYAEALRSAATRRAYFSDWTILTAWCDARGIEPLPASAAAVATFSCERSASRREESHYYAQGRGDRLYAPSQRLCCASAEHRSSGDPRRRGRYPTDERRAQDAQARRRRRHVARHAGRHRRGSPARRPRSGAAGSWHGRSLSPFGVGSTMPKRHNNGS